MQNTQALPGPAPKEVCIIIPALNEERTIGRVIRRIPRESLKVLGYTPRLLVADGNSVDATLTIARARGAEVVVQRGKGKGDALREVHRYLLEDAWDEAGGPREPRHYVILDADCTYPPETITDLVAALDSGYDVVLASRFLGIIHPEAMSRLNLLGNRLLTRLFHMFNDVQLTDVCTGMYAFNERVFQNLTLQADGFDVEADIFSSASLMHARFAEVPVDYSRRVGEPKLNPLRAGLQIGWRIVVGRMQRGTGQAILADTPRRPPHPFIAWAEQLRDASAPRKARGGRLRASAAWILAPLGLFESIGSSGRGDRRT